MASARRGWLPEAAPPKRDNHNHKIAEFILQTFGTETGPKGLVATERPFERKTCRPPSPEWHLQLQGETPLQTRCRYSEARIAYATVCWAGGSPKLRYML